MSRYTDDAAHRCFWVASAPADYRAYRAQDVRALTSSPAAVALSTDLMRRGFRFGPGTADDALISV